MDSNAQNSHDGTGQLMKSNFSEVTKWWLIYAELEKERRKHEAQKLPCGPELVSKFLLIHEDLGCVFKAVDHWTGRLDVQTGDFSTSV